MNFDYADEQIMLRDSAEKVVRNLCTLERRRARIACGAGFDPDMWSQAAELGWLALCVPEAEGGLGGSITDVALLMIELGRGMACDPMISSAVLCASLLGDSNWSGRKTWLERIMSGEARLAFSHLESGERFEQLAPRATTIKPTTDGYVLSGTKLLTLDGDGADAYLVSASTGDNELIIALVRQDAPGVSIDAYTLIDGSRAADFTFDKVAVDELDIVAHGASAASLIEDALARASIASLGAAIGSMETCLEICSDYLKTRQQFGQPIGKFQALQHIMADMLVATHNARSSLYHALSAFADAKSKRAAAIASAKLGIGQAGLMVSRSGVQLHGGYGVTDEYAISHHYRFQMALEKRFGDSQTHAAKLADLLFKNSA